MTDKDILTAKDIASLLGVTERTARRLITKHHLGMRIGKRWLVSRQKLLDVISGEYEMDKKYEKGSMIQKREA